MNTILDAAADFQTIELSDNYRIKGYKRHFEQHLNLMLNTSIEITQDSQRKSLLEDKNISIDDRLYYEVENFILENLDDTSDELEQELFTLEDILKGKIIASLGNFYDRGNIPLRLMIDNSVHNTLLAYKFDFFSRSLNYQNPWEASKKILIEDNFLYTFSTDEEKLKELGFKPKEANKNESELLRDKKINIVAKGHRREYGYDYVRDLLALRNLVFEIISDKSETQKTMKSNEIVVELRHLGIQNNELSDSSIKSWLIAPLKKTGKIGSYKEGYFVLDTCEDVLVSYNHHLENLRGYYRTLENHRKLANKFGCESEVFLRHRHLNNKDIDPLGSSLQ